MMEVYMYKNHRGNYELSIYRFHEDDEIIFVTETDEDLTMEGADVCPEIGHVVAVNGLGCNALVVAPQLL